MTTPIFDPDALECLAAIVEEGGFERAAQRLSITQSAVSQRLRALEAQVGTVLLVRSRPVRPTPAGQRLIKHAKMMRLLRADLARELRELDPTLAQRARDEGRLSIAVNADSIATWVLDALTPLIHDGVALEIIHDDQDFTHEWLREGQVMGCVTSLAQALRGCRLEPLGRMPYVAVASPALAQQLGGELTAHNFHRVPFIAFNRKDDLQRDFVCHAFGLSQVGLQQTFVPSSEGQVRAARAGWGISVVPRALAEPGLADGTLVDVAPRVRYGVALHWHCWSLPSEALARVSAALRETARQQLEPLSG
ncbi:putative HTH-type transcriptional regulator [Tepidimonas alkaliphilus]|uniref:Putative HTH-type transcriptional regulator n=1 Tax=Tepidimonas alkaliphilus TaxID=2588942 RepID=A0A554WBS9_9BURK|nr:LysR family transcriptional regulator ArgP [Tepidimonas alkaliphilus]TSE21025.1 putative HTH-type transcriptional regulator [Tepidimonas alkaliphilus]